MAALPVFPLFVHCPECELIGVPRSIDAVHVAPDWLPVLDGSRPIRAICGLCAAPVDAAGRLLPHAAPADWPRCAAGHPLPAAAGAALLECEPCARRLIDPALDRARRAAIARRVLEVRIRRDQLHDVDDRQVQRIVDLFAAGAPPDDAAPVRLRDLLTFLR